MTLHWWPKKCCTVGAQMANVSCLRLVKPEILCGKGLIHIGRGFHLPSIITLFTIMALEVLGASPPLRTDLSYGRAELFLRRRVHGTVFQPGAIHSFPGLITAKGLVEDVFLQLDCQNLALASQVATSIAHTAMYQLQLYWIDT